VQVLVLLIQQFWCALRVLHGIMHTAGTLQG
jgi:hypothetical protein